MKKTAKRLVVLLIIALCACVFPISLVRKSDTIDFAMNTDYYVISDPNIKDFRQTFIALTSYLDEIAFDVGIPGEISGEEKLVICIREEKSRKSDCSHGRAAAPAGPVCSPAPWPAV